MVCYTVMQCFIGVYSLCLHFFPSYLKILCWSRRVKWPKIDGSLHPYSEHCRFQTQRATVFTEETRVVLCGTGSAPGGHSWRLDGGALTALESDISLRSWRNTTTNSHYSWYLQDVWRRLLANNFSEELKGEQMLNLHSSDSQRHTNKWKLMLFRVP